MAWWRRLRARAEGMWLGEGRCRGGEVVVKPLGIRLKERV
jgi:hypothetical protein